MRIIKVFNIFILFLIAFQVEAQESTPYKIIEIEFQTIEKESNEIIIASVIEILSEEERIGIIHGDYDGISKFKVCSKKIKNGQITVNVYGMKCKPFQSKYSVDNDSKITINLDYGETKYKTLEDRKLIFADLNIPICDIEIGELEDNTSYYQHCDGRIKKKNEIPDIELPEWKKIEN